MKRRRCDEIIISVSELIKISKSVMVYVIHM